MIAPALLEALADAGSLQSIDATFDAPRRSPYLARWGIRAQDDDGLQVKTMRIAGAQVLVAAQDARFLGGSIGQAHAQVLERVFVLARDRNVDAVVLLLASGGVRLHEANPAEVALARALRALVDARAAEVPVLALCTGDVFGGASVLACAAERTGMLPAARLGLSGPKVIATARGSHEIDPDDAAGLAAIFGAAARAARRQADLVPDDAAAVRAWITAGIDGHIAFDRALREQHARLAADVASQPSPPEHAWTLPPAWHAMLAPLDAAAGLWRSHDGHTWVTAAAGDRALSPGALHALDAALLTSCASSMPRTLVIVEDSAGHEISRAAEERCVSRFLAHHACVIGALRAAGVKVGGILAGRGHSAAFFVNALQADRLIAAQGAQVMAMDPRAVARVTGLDAAALTAALDIDPVLGHAAPLLAQWGAIDAIVPAIDSGVLERLST